MQPARTRTAKDYMSRDLVVFRPDTDLRVAMRALLDNDISGAPVVDDRGNLIGILSEKDCFRAAFKASYYAELTGPVRDYMSSHVETIDADMAIVEVVELFFRSTYRRFPVMAGGQLVGQLTRRDVLEAVVELW
jgi:predicted transcriptional regulator